MVELRLYLTTIISYNQVIRVQLHSTITSLELNLADLYLILC